MSISLTFKGKKPKYEVSLYCCPTAQWHSIKSWPQRHQHYRKGFVFRVLCFGFVLRYGKPLRIPSSRAEWASLVEQLTT